MNQALKKLLISAIASFIYFYAIKVFWGYFPNINPITNGLFSCCAASSWILSTIYVHDIIINILLCIPLAVFLIKLNTELLWLIVIVALIPSFIYGSYHLLLPEYAGRNVSDFAFGWSIELLCLPIALLLMQMLFWGKRGNR